MAWPAEVNGRQRGGLQQSPASPSRRPDAATKPATLALLKTQKCLVMTTQNHRAALLKGHFAERGGRFLFLGAVIFCFN